MHRYLALSVLGAIACTCVLAAALAAGCGGATASEGGADAGTDTTIVFDGWAGGDASAVSDGSEGGLSWDTAVADAPGADSDAWASPCPGAPPAPGSSCSAINQVCEYGSSWWLGCNLTVACRSNGAGVPVWTVDSDGGGCGWLDSGGACPPTWQEAMAVEAGPGQCPFVSCVYPEGFCGCGIGCGGGGGAPRSLDVAGIFVCIPATPGCPEPRPLSGTPCEAGSGCDYGFACGCGQMLQCNGGTWEAYRSPPCP